MENINLDLARNTNETHGIDLFNLNILFIMKYVQIILQKKELM